MHWRNGKKATKGIIMKTCGLIKKGQHGFTILELAIALCIFAIVLGLGLPGLKNWSDGSRINAATRDMCSKLKKAKAAATQSNTPCAVTFNQPAGGEVYDFIAFLDADGNFEYDAGETIIAQARWADYKYVSFDAAQGGGDGISNTFQANPSGFPVLSFLPNGLPIDVNGALVSGSVFLVNIPQGGDTSRITKNLNVSVTAAGGIGIS